MAIRLRTVAGVRVALCAAETDVMPGDIYLDDADHYAIAAKYAQDHQGETIATVYPKEWAAMETQKLRDACDELMKWQAMAAATEINAHIESAKRWLWHSMESESSMVRIHCCRQAALDLFNATALSDGKQRCILAAHFRQADALAGQFGGDGMGAQRLLDELGAQVSAANIPATAPGQTTIEIHTCPKCGAQGAAFICSEPGCPVNGGAAYGPVPPAREQSQITPPRQLPPGDPGGNNIKDDA